MEKVKKKSYAIFLIFFISFILSNNAYAHFLLNLNVRIMHVVHTNDGLVVYARIPMPYLVATSDNQYWDGDRKNIPNAQYSKSVIENGKLMHYLDIENLDNNLNKIGNEFLTSLHIESGNKELKGSITNVKLYKVGEEADFSDLQSAIDSFSENINYSSLYNTYVGDVVLDFRINYKSSNNIDSYKIKSDLNPGLLGQEKTENIVLDYSPGDIKVFRSKGLMSDFVYIDNSPWKAMKTFVEQGVMHILGGIDHVFFVICLVMASRGVKSVLWKSTGFTIGHSVTLAMGFLGYVPSGSWFIPLIETGIAISIIYAAALCLDWDVFKYIKIKNGSYWSELYITFLLGLLHGLGFSFMLHEILQVNSPNIWKSLLSFNFGVEIGQLIIILMTYPVFNYFLINKYKTHKILVSFLSVIFIFISLYWCYDRFSMFVTSFL
ncbi:HupE/UreJ family protein [Vibrio mimicus]